MAYTQGVQTLIPATSAAGIICLCVFALSYFAVLMEESIRLRKSASMMLGAGIIWIVIALAAPGYGVSRNAMANAAVFALMEYGGLLLFLIVSMVFVSALQERNVFLVLQDRLARKNLNARQILWLTGGLAFLLSMVANNLTTALVAGAVIMVMGRGNKRFIGLCCINAVNAANAGGLASPFGDITTLMVWQSGHVGFFAFFRLLLPALAAFVIPAGIMGLKLSKKKPPPRTGEPVVLKPGAWIVMAIGLLSIVMTVVFQQVLDLPAFMGMMTGFALLMIAARFVISRPGQEFAVLPFLAAVEWDTLLFFFGVIFSVAGLAFMGYIDAAAKAFYGFGIGVGNIGLGLVSSVVDNIPIMYAVLSMRMHMDGFQWLLVTLTTGLGGSLLPIGSAAGVALMGVAREEYTFRVHLRWAPVLFLGYLGAVVVHFVLN